MADPETTFVPNLVNLTQSEAEQILKNAGLMLGTVATVSSPTTPKGSVSASNPPAGASVSSGSAVNLDVSSGQTVAATPNFPAGSQPAVQVSVPNVVGLTRPAAETILKSAGLIVGAVRTQHSDSVPDGGVSQTDPEAGTPVNAGSAVELDLSNGPEPNWTQYVPTVLFALLGFTILGLIVYGITQESGQFLKNLAQKEVARGLITFLIAIATVGIAIILAISTLVLTEGDAGDKRFDRGKQVLTILIGVLGTIVGFYFGSAPDTTGGQPKSNTTEQVQTSAPKITTATLPEGTVNKVYQTTTLQATGLKPPLKWSVTPTLPPSLVLNSETGAITGTPTEPKAKTPFKFTVTDGSVPPVTSTADLSLEIKQ